MTMGKRLVAEALGTGLLVTAVVGSGIMAEQLAGGNVAVALLGNTVSTVATLMALIFILGPISGAHFNPAVSVAMAMTGALRWREVPGYVVAQAVGGLAGTVAAHGMFGLALMQASQHVRTGPAQWLSEFVAAFGLVMVIFGCLRARPSIIPIAVGLYIAGAYWFTASTSFANPAVTLARAYSDTFAGIRPADVPGFVVAQLVGAVAATGLSGWLFGEERG
jgi:glycerol uptake facilitator-like aquaporin